MSKVQLQIQEKKEEEDEPVIETIFEKMPEGAVTKIMALFNEKCESNPKIK